MRELDEFGIREILGVKHQDKPSRIIAEELTALVQVIVEDSGGLRAICLKPDEALKFSRQLSRIARRVEARNA